MILVTGANGFVGSRLCHELADRAVEVRALVRRAGTAPDRHGVTEVVGEFDDPDAAPGFVDGVDAVVTTVAPMGADHETQHRVSVDGTTMLAAAARDAGVGLLVHVSTCAVYDRHPDQGDVDETSAYVDDEAGAYAVTKRDADLSLAELDGITRVLVRPPAIMGPGPTSVWNTWRPTWLADDPSSLAPNPDQTFAWVHVDDLARFLADVATGAATPGPADGDVTAVNVAAPDATWRDYLEPVAAGVGVEPFWSDEPAWTGRIVAERARSWGWAPTVTLDQAIRELLDDLDDPGGPAGSADA